MCGQYNRVCGTPAGMYRSIGLGPARGHGLMGQRSVGSCVHTHSQEGEGRGASDACGVCMARAVASAILVEKVSSLSVTQE